MLVQLGAQLKDHLQCFLNTLKQTFTHTLAARKEKKKKIQQFLMIKSKLKLANLGWHYTWEFPKAIGKVSKGCNWRTSSILNRSFIVHLYYKLRKIHEGQGTRILNRLVFMCKIWFSTQISQSVWTDGFTVQLNGSHMAEIPLKSECLAWYLSKILYDLELFDKYISSYCPGWFVGRKGKMEEIFTGMIFNDRIGLAFNLAENSIMKIWKGALGHVITSHQRKEEG